MPAPALAAPAVDAAAAVQLRAGSVDLAGPSILEAKKKRKKKAGAESATLDDFGSVKRGKRDVRVTATVAKVGRTCELKIKYANGDADTPDAVTADANKVCALTFDVSDERDAVGKAKAELTVKDGKGKKVTSVSRTFTVKS